MIRMIDYDQAGSVVINYWEQINYHVYMKVIVAICTWYSEKHCRPLTLEKMAFLLKIVLDKDNKRNLTQTILT